MVQSTKWYKVLNLRGSKCEVIKNCISQFLNSSRAWKMITQFMSQTFNNIKNILKPSLNTIPTTMISIRHNQVAPAQLFSLNCHFARAVLCTGSSTQVIIINSSPSQTVKTVVHKTGPRLSAVSAVRSDGFSLFRKGTILLVCRSGSCTLNQL